MVNDERFTKFSRDKRIKMRSNVDAMEYAYKKAFDVILEYIHLDIDLKSASVDESKKSVETESLVWLQQYVSKRIDECEDLRGSTKTRKVF